MSYGVMCDWCGHFDVWGDAGGGPSEGMMYELLISPAENYHAESDEEKAEGQRLEDAFQLCPRCTEEAVRAVRALAGQDREVSDAERNGEAAGKAGG